MNVRMRIAALAVAGVGALGLGVGTAGTALAGTGSGTVIAVTHTSHHPDTCSCTTNTPSSNGDVWAYDNLARQFRVTYNGGIDYTVVVTDNGSFAAFAEPNNPDLSTFFPITAKGSIRGTITYDVQSLNSPSGLPAQVPSDMSTTATIQLLFNDPSAVVTGGDYTYTYTAGGDTYVQSSQPPFITGDITGH